MRSVLCAQATWRAAVDRLLDAADLVVLDLSSYTDQAKTMLQRVLDRVPAELGRFAWLIPVSKAPILEAAIGEAWAHMSADSPNVVYPEMPAAASPSSTDSRSTVDPNTRDHQGHLGHLHARSSAG